MKQTIITNQDLQVTHAMHEILDDILKNTEFRAMNISTFIINALVLFSREVLNPNTPQQNNMPCAYDEWLAIANQVQRKLERFIKETNNIIPQ